MFVNLNIHTHIVRRIIKKKKGLKHKSSFDLITYVTHIYKSPYYKYNYIEEKKSNKSPYYIVYNYIEQKNKKSNREDQINQFKSCFGNLLLE